MNTVKPLNVWFYITCTDNQPIHATSTVLQECRVCKGKQYYDRSITSNTISVKYVA